MHPIDRTLAGAVALALISLPTASTPLAAASLGLLGTAALASVIIRAGDSSGQRDLGGLRMVEGNRLDDAFEAEGTIPLPLLVRARDQSPEIAEPSILPAPRVTWGSFRIEDRSVFELPVPGTARVGPLLLELFDPLALTRWTIELREPEVIQVWPSAESLRDHPLRSRFQHILAGAHSVRNPGSSQEFYGLREYNPGDAMRDVNWKATVREQELMVNQYEHETHGELNVFLDARLVTTVGTGRHNPSHGVVRVAATLGELAWAQRDTLRALAFGPVEHASFRPDPGSPWRDQYMDWLASLTPRGECDASVVFDEVVAQLTPRSMAVFITPFVGDNDPLGDAPMRAKALDNSVLVIASPLPAGLEPAILEGLKAQRERWISHIQELGFEVVDMEREPTLAVALLHWGGER